jgi:hypothetical protein
MPKKTSSGKSASPSTKKAAKKKITKRVVRRAGRGGVGGGTELANHLGVPSGFRAEFAASLQGCLDKAVATKLVFSCTGVGSVDPATTLGQLFPSDERRSGFAGCVFNKAAAANVQVSPGSIPSAATITIEDVIDSISC